MVAVLKETAPAQTAVVSLKSLKQTLAPFASVVPSKSANPIWACVELAPGNRPDVLTITGDDTNTALTATINAAHNLTARVLVNYRGLKDAIAAHKGDGLAELQVSPDLTRLTVSFGGSRSTVPCVVPLDASDGPCVFENRPEFVAALPARDLLALLEATYAAANEEFRAIFRGAQFEFSGGNLRVMATDGFRLAYADTEAECSAKAKAVVLAGALDVLGKVAKSCELVRIGASYSPRHLWVSAGDYRARFTLLDGEMPDYERVIPTRKDAVTVLTLDAAPVADWIKRAAKGVGREARVHLTVGAGRLHCVVTSLNTDNEAATDFPIANVARDTSAGRALGFRVDHLCGALSQCATEGATTVHLFANETTAFDPPAILESGRQIAVVVPLKKK